MNLVTSPPSVLKLPNVDKQLISYILDEVVETKPQVKFGDIGGQDEAKRALEEVVILPVLRPEVRQTNVIEEDNEFLSSYSPVCEVLYEEFFSLDLRAMARLCW